MRRRLTDSMDFEVGELNLVPYMDIMVNLIIFMLFSMTGFVQMKIINVSVPSISDSGTGSTNDQDDKKKLSITLAMLEKKGYVITVDGRFVQNDGELIELLPPGEYSVKPTADNKFDFDGIHVLMEKVKQRDIDVTAITLTADKTVDYQSLVKTMDAIRYTGDKLLYPDVLLGVLP